MKQNDLKRLRRTDLLELLLELSRENDLLRKENRELKQRLEDRAIAIENTGSLAEASLQLNGIFEAAQNACDQYIQNIQMRSRNMEEHCRQMEQQAQEKCDLMLANARKKVRFYLELAKEPGTEPDDVLSWLETILNNGEDL